MRQVGNIGEVIDEIFDEDRIRVADDRDVIQNAFQNFCDILFGLSKQTLNEPVHIEFSEYGLGKTTTFSEYVDNFKHRLLEIVSQRRITSMYDIVDLLEEEKALPLHVKYLFWDLKDGRRH